MVSYIFYLAIFAIVIAGLIGVYLTVTNNIKTSNLIRQVYQITATVDRAYQFQATYENGSMIQTVVVGGDMRDNATGTPGNYQLWSPFETEITVVGNGARDYTLTINDLVDGTCTTMLNTFGAGRNDVEAITVNGTALTVPVTPATVSANCDGNADNQYDVALTF